MSYKTLQRACRFYYEPRRRSEVIKQFGSICYLSSGVNHLPTVSIIKEQVAREFENDHFYSSYPGQGGSLMFLATVAYAVNELYMRGRNFTITPANVCATVGATGGLSASFDYLVRTCGTTSALVLGLNYSFFSLWCDRWGIEYHILKSSAAERILPTVNEAVDAVRRRRPDLVILTQPANPSGEYYSAEELTQIATAVRKLGSWFMVDEVPNMANANDSVVPPLLSLVEGSRFPEKVVVVNSFSKSRSLAGVRLGYVLANEEMIQYLRDFNDSMYWSPGNIAPSSLSSDLLLRVLSRRVEGLQGKAREREIKTGVRRFRHYVSVLAGLSDDLTRRSDNLEYIGAERDWSQALEQSERELEAIYEVYAGNWKKFGSEMGQWVEESIEARHGFNHCVRLKVKLTEEDFCRQAFLQAGVDFYTERMFSESDDTSGKVYWVRISCAVKREVFDAGLERLARFLKKAA